ncbi:hypothetical protein EVAR_85663_1 [Eumeta japonica]|uniref:Uncharacterized protein n=1 Tax=Eumeta variegata TaxID=151549 RepID=A0A4C1WAI6_EUMVA|nr:hypothetical protein EVAR_85663_1 [Eumeta japonica]
MQIRDATFAFKPNAGPLYALQRALAVVTHRYAIVLSRGLHAYFVRVLLTFHKNRDVRVLPELKAREYFSPIGPILLSSTNINPPWKTFIGATVILVLCQVVADLAHDFARPNDL